MYEREVRVPRSPGVAVLSVAPHLTGSIPASQVVGVAILDDVAVTRAGFADVVARLPQCRVVFSGSGVDDFERDGACADVFVLALHGDADAETADTVRSLAERGGVLVAVSPKHAASSAAMVRAGALGCVTTHAEEREIAAAVRTVADGGLHVCADAVAALHAELTQQEEKPPSTGPSLSPREVEALRHVAGGLTHAQAARRMGLTESTVNYYVGRVRAKLNAGNKAQLATRAVELGYLRGSAAA